MVDPAASKKTHVPHKWGFGMAPLKPAQTERWDAAVSLVDRYMADEREAFGRRDELVGAVSEVKGLFSRCWKNDQWDWFVVYTRLGSPTNRLARHCSEALGALGRGLRSGDEGGISKGRADFIEWGGPRWLAAWASGERPLDQGWGFIYVLSTRENPDMLKVGYTNRSVGDRVAEINRATGVVVPYGARRAWRVRDAHAVEGLVHTALGEYRVREDREFFHLPARDALRIVDRVVVEHRLEG